MKKVVSIILSICILLGCFATVAFAGSNDIKITVVKAPKSIKLGQSIEDVGGFEVKISNLSQYIGEEYYIYQELDGAKYFHIDNGGAGVKIKSNTLTVNHGWVDGWEYYKPGKITVKLDIWDGYGGVTVSGMTLFEVVVEDAVIKTNAPKYAAVGSTISLKTELTNVGTKNIKIADYDNPIEKLEDFDKELKDFLTYADEYPLAYQPKVEIIQGKNLVKQSSQNYSNILSTSEKLTFKGEGVVKLKVKYNQLNPDDYNTDWSTSLNGWWNNDGEYEYIRYSPEKIITINVVDTNKISLPSKNYTGLCKYNNKWFYAKDGEIDFSFTGLCKYNGKWYYVNKGVVDKSYTGLVKHTDGKYYYVKSGVKTSFNGLVKYNGKWYHVKDGVKSSYTGLVKHTDGKYYYVKSGVKTSFNGLVKYNSKWYHVKDGVKTTYTGLAKHTDGKWYYINKGAVDKSYTGNV
ncbi:MAG: hypothetical protein IKW45_09740, partial [Clostridia bacterium]|nr:hypothetical protein [Clostridia bacterium]